MRSLSCLLAALFTVLFFTNATAQEAEKYENPEWYSFVYVDYHPGMMGEARNIIDNYFKKASAQAGTPIPVMEISLAAGEYDMLIVWKMEDGVEGMNWKTSPSQVKWRAAMNELAGGEDQAKEIMENYRKCIRSSSSNMGRKL
ncbi:hypothetical protein [Robertkochia sediminum]|uniref:hypothetical protein n=1 Tax=Robertkochia sediminum TaxID=2785326 RepID=UPI001933B916|nr:hypothetical protein [Robertkochia sediminum]MBL7472677.1 hypothetical protein [Robertkochia sediminum]